MIQYSFFPADNRLSEYIFSYGLMEIAEGLTVPLLSPPNGLSGFLIRIKSDKNGEVIGKDIEGNPIAYQPSYVIGQTTFPITGYAKGQLSFLVVFFQPLGLNQLFGCNMQPLANKSVDLMVFLGATKAQQLVDELKTKNSIAAQLDILNDFFLQQIPANEDTVILKKSLELIQQAKGNITIKKIEDSLSINRRTLERQFQQKIGISPKVYAQVLRFKFAMNYLEANPTATWTELTYNSGFFDQAHMIRYFKEYLKVSPNNLVQLDVNFINYLLKH